MVRFHPPPAIKPRPDKATLRVCLKLPKTQKSFRELSRQFPPNDAVKAKAPCSPKAIAPEKSCLSKSIVKTPPPPSPVKKSTRDHIDTKECDPVLKEPEIPDIAPASQPIVATDAIVFTPVVSVGAGKGEIASVPTAAFIKGQCPAIIIDKTSKRKIRFRPYGCAAGKYRDPASKRI